MSASSKLRLSVFGVAAIAVACIATPACAQATPDGENGRYSFSQAADGSVLRLDTRTGNIATCSKHETAGWACYMVPSERDALDAEIGRLVTENNGLKEQLARRDAADASSKTDSQSPRVDSPKQGDASGAGKSGTKGNRIELQLPDDQDIDRMIAFLERAWRRLVDAANRFQRDVSGKI